MSGSSRWCPTPEQLMILEEIYKGGIRTPNASQIQNITCKLSRYGKIEGKNVFYWFQNHKARDRQKLRRKQFLLTKLQQIQQQQQHNYHHYQHLLPPSAATLHHPPMQSHHYNYPLFHHQGYGRDEYSYPQVKQSRLETADINPNTFENKSMMKIYNDDNWRKGSNDSTWCNNRSEPLKTLQLFPTKSNNLI